MYIIKTNSGYVTRKSIGMELTTTNNINFAYVFPSEQEAEKYKKCLKIESEIVKM